MKTKPEGESKESEQEADSDTSEKLTSRDGPAVVSHSWETWMRDGVEDPQQLSFIVEMAPDRLRLELFKSWWV